MPLHPLQEFGNGKEHSKQNGIRDRQAWDWPIMEIVAIDDRFPFAEPDIAFRHCVFRADAEQPMTHYDHAGPPAFMLHVPETVQNSVAKRRAEFLAGRLCATLALNAASGLIVPIPIGSDRRPVWPEAYIGSITHAQNKAAAVVAPRACYSLLGLDIETMIPAEEAEPIAELIVSPAEMAFLPVTMRHPAFLTLVFSAKEALYKALYPHLRRIIEFHDLTLVALTDGHLIFEPHPALKLADLPRDAFKVAYRWKEDHVLCLAALPEA
jgi:enterobactin synthetase component D